MIRPFTLLCFFAFAGAGAWLYQVKHAVAMKDRELLEIQRQTDIARQRIEILRAEWALLNEPDRLRQTATRVLTLEPMQPQHFVRLNDLERRLPGAVAFAGAPDMFGPAHQAGAVMLASARSPAPAQAAAAAPAQAVAAPAGAAAGALAEAASRVPEAPAPRALAATVAAQRAEQAARPAPRPAQPAPPRPIQPAVHVTPAPAAPAEPVTRVTRAAPPETSVASALGGGIAPGRPMLAPPVPIAPAAAATLR